MKFTRTFPVVLSVCLTISACGRESSTEPYVRASSTPRLDGIGMVGGGGRSDHDEAGPATLPGTDSVIVASATESETPE